MELFKSSDYNITGDLYIQLNEKYSSLVLKDYKNRGFCVFLNDLGQEIKVQVLKVKKVNPEIKELSLKII